MEMYAAHKQTGARLIRAAPLIHRQPPACTSPGLFLGSFTKQMYLIKKETPEQPESESCTAVSKGAALSPGGRGDRACRARLTLGSPRHSQKPPVRPATGLKSFCHNPNGSWYLPAFSASFARPLQTLCSPSPLHWVPLCAGEPRDAESPS